MSTFLPSRNDPRTWVCLVALIAGACALNPQPEDPFGETPPDTMGGTGTGGTSHLGGAMLGTGGTGANGTIGEAGSPATGGTPAGDWCVGDAEDALIDDAADCDASVALSGARRGTWFAYDSAPQTGGTLEPAPTSPFAMTPTANGDCAARLAGGSYPNNATDGFGYAGIGISLDTAEGQACAGGYDAQAYAGLTFRALGPGALRVLVETVDTAAASGRPNGYATEVEVGASWATTTVSWTDLVLLDGSSDAPGTLDPAVIRTIRFEPVDPTQFVFWIDDVAFVTAVSGGGGAGGQSAGGAAGSG